MRIVFIGTGDIGLPALRSLLASSEHNVSGVLTQPDKPAGRAQRLQPPPIKTALEGTGIPVFQPERIKRAEVIAQIRELAPDVIVVMAYGQILPRAVLEIPRIACLNLHASLLPRHRGAAPIQAAIVAGDSETGITVMYMDEGLDTGDILLQHRIEITPDDTGGSLHDRLGEIAPAALVDALCKLQNGTAPRTVQSSAEATAAPKLEREDGRIDWAEPAVLIERKIRAFNPWPGAFTMVRDDSGRESKLKILSASAVDVAGKPGEIRRGDHDSITIFAKHGALGLGRVQLAGKWPMSAGEFARGHTRLLAQRAH